MTDASKKYGLQIPVKKKSIFTQDDDDESINNNSSNKNNSSKPTDYLAELMKQKKNSNVEKTLKSALEDDPSSFDYDSFYDSRNEEIKSSKKKGLLLQQQQNKQSKYIAGLMESAEQKKKNLERVKEIQIQKERDAESDRYGDKESFVTSAYKEKLEKDKLERHLEKEKDEKEQSQNLNSNLNSFHKNLFNNMYNNDNNNKPIGISPLTENQNKYTQLSDKYDKYDNYDRKHQEQKQKYYQNNNNGSRIVRDYDEKLFREHEKKVDRGNDDNVFLVRRNDNGSIQLARDRYLKRKQEREQFGE